MIKKGGRLGKERRKSQKQGRFKSSGDKRRGDEERREKRMREAVKRRGV